MDMKIKRPLLPYSLPERWFRKKAELHSEVFNIKAFLFLFLLFFLNIRIQYDLFIQFSSIS